jgi:hypothetical protein
MTKFFCIAVVFLSSLFFSATDLFASDKTPRAYPVPPVNDHSLFYIQRNKNTSTIVYETNLRKDGLPDPKNPLNIYWISYSSDSSVNPLTVIQRKYAYGITSRPYNGRKDAFVFQFVAYGKRDFYLLPQGNKKYLVFTNINGKFAEFKKLFIQLNGGTFWFPTIEYIELTGKDPVTHQTITERFKP